MYIYLDVYHYIDIHAITLVVGSDFQAEPKIGLCFTPVDGASAAAKVRGGRNSIYLGLKVAPNTVVLVREILYPTWPKLILGSGFDMIL